MTTARIPATARTLRRLAAVYSGESAGAFTLPEPLLAARDGIARLAEAINDAGHVDVARAEAKHVADLAAAALANGPLPDVAELLAVEAAAAANGRRVRLLGSAVERADTALSSLADELTDEVVTGHLQPAVEQVMDSVAKAAKVLPDQPDAETLLRASDQARKAWFALGDLAARYASIRAAHAALRRTDDGPRHDVHGYYAELHNWAEVTAGYVMKPGGPRPWPSETPARLLWYVRHGGTVWCPTVSQQDARFMEVHGDEVRRLADHRARLTAAA